MKILQLSSAQEFGGAERHVSELSIELKKLGHEIHLVVRPKSPLPELVKSTGVKCYEMPLSGAVDIFSAYKLAKLAKKLEIDIIHSHYGRDYPLTALAIRLCHYQKFYPKFFLTRHHYLPVRANWAYRRLLNVLDCAITVSNSVSSTLAKSFHWEISDPKLKIIPNWINTQKFSLSQTKEESRLLFSIDPNKTVIGIVNQLTMAKGQHLLLEALYFLQDKIKDDYLIVFAGSEHDSKKPYTKFLEDLINKFKLNNKVKFLGHVKNLASLYKALDIIVIPSENEAFSIVCLEAMVSACPVIASDVGGLAELVKEGKTGLLFPVNDSRTLSEKLFLLLSNQELREGLVKNAQLFTIENFAIEKVISKIEDLYKKSILTPKP
ncbi:MAG: glycosyltransferase family 4 protein [Acidobacteria bacterium]|nr:glycosyltransferase family 4 protein [Acidobacteriota bacterium]